jgi:hypothetical protein
MDKPKCLLFSSFQLVRQSDAESEIGGSGYDFDCTRVANPSLVSRYFEQHSRGLVFDTEAKDALVSIPKSISHTSVNENEFSCFSDIGKLLQDYGLSEDTSDNLISSWRPSTRQQYWTYFKKWLLFCSQRKVDPFKATEIDVLNFLTHLYTSGLAYSTLNTVRCIFSSVLSIDKHVTIE